MFLFLFNNLFGTYLTYKMVGILLKKQRVGVKVCVAAYLIYYVINSAVFFVFQNDRITLTSNYICLYIIVFLLYDEFIWKKILVPLLLAAVGFCTEDMFWYLMMNFRNPDPLIVSVLTNLAFCIILAVLHGHFCGEVNDLHSKSMNFLLILLPVTSMVLVLALDTNENAGPMAVGISGIIILNISLFLLYAQLVKAYQKEMEQYMLSQRVRQYEHQFELMKENRKRISAIRHDLKNHLIVLKRLISDEKVTEAMAYLEQMEDSIRIEREYVKTGNDVVDSIFNFYVDEAKELGTKIELQIQIPTVLPIATLDVSIILGNLLQNAVEALRDCGGEKKLKAVLKLMRGALRLIVVNTYNGKPLLTEGKRLKSTKAEPKEHGHGLQNVWETVKKYDGDMEYSTKDNEFEVNIFILTG